MVTPNSLSLKRKYLRLTTHGFLSSIVAGDLIHGSDLVFSSRPTVFSSDFRVHSSTLFQQLSASLSLYFHHQRHPLQSSLFINSGIDLLFFPSINSFLFRLQSSVFGSSASSSVFTVRSSI